MNPILQLYLVCLALATLQFVAALPWVSVLLLPAGREVSWQEQLFSNKYLRRNIYIGLAINIASGMLVGFMKYLQDHSSLEWWGRIYGAILHLQLIIDFFVLTLGFLLLVWPKGAAVALATFREGLRQPMFWLLLLLAVVFINVVNPLVPYFTLGDDQVMVKEMGYELIMLLTLIFGVVTACMSIADEIEGRTAITLMSKPVSRRQFLLGKFVGIYFAGLVLVGMLGWCFNWMVLFKQWLAPLEGNIETVPPPPAFVGNFVDALVQPGVAADFLRGAFLWLADSLQNFPGLVLGACQVMVLLAVAVALATRATMIINLVVCLVVYVLGHLSPVLLEIARNRLKVAPNEAGPQLLSFVARLLSSILPESGYFSVSPALVTDSPPELGDFYGEVGLVVIYAVLYTTIVLLAGLLSFEDRDLA